MLCPHTAQKNKGFTLIELLIVISIISLVTGLVVPLFTRYSESQSLRQAQEKLKSDLRTAQNNAMTGANSTTVEYWGIKFTDDGTSYALFNSNTNSDCAAADIVIVRPSMGLIQAGIQTKLTTTPVCVWFSELTGERTGPSSISIGYPGATGTECRRIDLSPVGLITAVEGLQICP